MIVIEAANSGTGMNASDWVTIVAALLAFTASIVAVIFSKKSSQKSDQIAVKIGELSAVSQDKQRLIETISTQRIEWINSVRNNFADFNKSAELFSIKVDIVKKRGESAPVEDFETFREIIFYSDLIYLYLNPTEKLHDLYMKTQTNISLCLADASANPLNFNYDEYGALVNRLLKLQQIILKSEWKIVKMETSNGTEVETSKKVSIYKEVAQKINNDIYEELKSG